MLQEPEAIVLSREGSRAAAELQSRLRRSWTEKASQFLMTDFFALLFKKTLKQLSRLGFPDT